MTVTCLLFPHQNFTSLYSSVRYVKNKTNYLLPNI